MTKTETRKSLVVSLFKCSIPVLEDKFSPSYPDNMAITWLQDLHYKIFFDSAFTL